MLPSVSVPPLWDTCAALSISLPLLSGNCCPIPVLATATIIHCHLWALWSSIRERQPLWPERLFCGFPVCVFIKAGHLCWSDTPAVGVWHLGPRMSHSTAWECQCLRKKYKAAQEVAGSSPALEKKLCNSFYTTALGRFFFLLFPNIQ